MTPRNQRDNRLNPDRYFDETIDVYFPNVKEEDYLPNVVQLKLLRKRKSGVAPPIRASGVEKHPGRLPGYGLQGGDPKNP